MNTPTYFDYHATTPTLPDVEVAMRPYWEKNFGNPSSAHSWGQRADLAVQRARGLVARLLHTTAPHIVFTSGATESLHMALAGWTLAQKKTCHIITSTIEHKATYGACRLAEKLGAKVSIVPVETDGTVLVEKILSLIEPDQPTLVSLIHGNNEIGTVQPIDEIARRLHQNPHAFLHVDAAQSVGKIKIDLTTTPIDFLSLSGHKIYGPKGVGALYVGNPSTLEPLFSGGGQEANLRAGTHNVPSIVGLGKACEWFILNGEAESARLQKLQELFFKLLQPVDHLIQIHGSRTSRLPNNINFSLLDCKSETLENEFENFAYSSGSACSSQPREASHVLKAIGVNDTVAENTFRIGLGLHTSEPEIRDFCERFNRALLKSNRKPQTQQ